MGHNASLRCLRLSYFFPGSNQSWCFFVKFLLDLNLETMDYILDYLEISPAYNRSEEFIAAENIPDTCEDLREKIHPKLDPAADARFKPITYMLVFSDRFGFQPNLSIIDLLFNEGPNAPGILESCIKNA